MRKAILLLFTFVFGLSVIFGCAKEPTESADILTQKPRDKNKTEVTVMVKYAFSINAFEQAVEEKFPDINLIQVGNFSADMGKDEYAARIKNDDLTDIVMTWPLEVGEEYWEDRLIDLSTLSVTRKYTTKSLNSISRGQEGKLYYLPGPSQVRGIVYNKTMFEENGWQIPGDLDGFIALCEKIEGTGVRALQLGLANSEVLDTAFVGYGFAECFATPESAAALAAFDRGETSFADHFMPALNTFQKLVDKKVLRPEDLNVYYQDRERMLFERECAMVEDSVLMARIAHATGGDEFALMPFFNEDHVIEGDYNDWARLYPVCYIGLNKHLEDRGNEEKYKAVLKLIEYISTPEGQERLAADTGAMFSNLKGASATETVEAEAMSTALNAGRYGVFPTLKNAQNALRTGLADMVRGAVTAEEVVELVDVQNSNPPAVLQPSILGESSADFTMLETANFFADAMRRLTNADFALIPDNGKDGRYNGKGVSGRFYKGVLLESDIKRVLPDLKKGETGEVLKIVVTGAGLLEALEYSFEMDNGESGWFYYFSGLKMEFSPSASPGKRIKSIFTDDGKAIDPDAVYSVAVPYGSVPQRFILRAENTKQQLRDVVCARIGELKVISPARDNRFIVV